MNLPFRIGFGYDVHQFADDRKLMLGGIEIHHDKGLKGHSDADALLHAITDALLGALSLGDIGTHFPDTSAEFKDADSKVLLKEAYKLVKGKKYLVGNIDATVVTESPKLKPHITAIQKSIAQILETDYNQISVKATTSERMGFVGEEKGLKAYAVVLIQKSDD